MPDWFVKFSAMAAIGLVGCFSTTLVASSINATKGMMIPFWILAANFWWIALLLAPWAWGARRGCGVRGFLISAFVVTAVFTLPRLYITQLREAVVPATVNIANLAPPPEQGIDSLEILLTDDAFHLHDCEVLCQQLLTGGDLRWVRMASAPDTRLPRRTIVYYHATDKDCAALQPDFPKGALCLLARADDGEPADLQMHVTELGDFYAPLEQNPGAVALTGMQKLVITDLRNGRELIHQTRYGWVEPRVGLVQPQLVFGVTIGSTGRFQLRTKRRFVGTIDLRASLASIGVKMSAPRPTSPFDSPAEYVWSHGRYISRFAYDAPLMTTAFAVAAGEPVPTGTPIEMHLKRLSGLVDIEPVVTLPPARLRDGRRQRVTGAADGAAKLAPVQAGRLAEDDLDSLLEQVAASDGLDGLHALNIVKDTITGAPEGAYDAYGEAFLAARKTAPGLTPLLGKFAFDPTPHLRGLWTKGADGPTDYLVMQAACGANARWAGALAPFVLEAGESLLPRYRDPKFFGAGLMDAVQVLVHLSRPDLAQALVDQIDWAVVDGLSPIAKFGHFPAVTRDLLLSRIADPMPCRS